MWLCYLIAIGFFLIDLYLIKHIEEFKPTRLNLIIAILILLIPGLNLALYIVAFILILCALIAKDLHWKNDSKLLKWLNKPI